MSASFKDSIGSLVIDDNDPFFIENRVNMNSTRNSRESSILSEDEVASYKSGSSVGGGAGASPSETKPKSNPMTFNGGFSAKTRLGPSSVPVIITQPSPCRRHPNSLISTPDRQHTPDSYRDGSVLTEDEANSYKSTSSIGTTASSATDENRSKHNKMSLNRLFSTKSRQATSSIPVTITQHHKRRGRRTYSLMSTPDREVAPSKVDSKKGKANSRLSLDEASSPRSLPRLLRTSFNRLVGSLTGGNRSDMDRQRAQSFHNFDRDGSISPESFSIPDTPCTRAYVEEMKSSGLPVIPFAHPLTLSRFGAPKEDAPKSPTPPPPPPAEDTPSRKRNPLKSQSSLSDDFFDPCRHGTLESLVGLAQQEIMMMEGGFIDLYEADLRKSVKPFPAEQDDSLFYTPKEPRFSINFKNSQDYLDMTAGMRGMRLKSEALPILEKK